VHGNADRLHSAPMLPARGHLARQPSRPMDPRAVAEPRPAATKVGAAPPTRPVAIGFGGPHAQATARVGGPAFSRTTRSATIDGKQLHHK
jgi:hypothetical protein